MKSGRVKEGGRLTGEKVGNERESEKHGIQDEQAQWRFLVGVFDSGMEVPNGCLYLHLHLLCPEQSIQIMHAQLSLFTAPAQFATTTSGILVLRPHPIRPPQSPSTAESYSS